MSCQKCKYKDQTIEAQRRSIVALSYELAEKDALLKAKTAALERGEGWMKAKEEAA